MDNNADTEKSKYKNVSGQLTERSAFLLLFMYLFILDCLIFMTIRSERSRQKVFFKIGARHQFRCKYVIEAGRPCLNEMRPFLFSSVFFSSLF